MARKFVALCGELYWKIEVRACIITVTHYCANQNSEKGDLAMKYETPELEIVLFENEDIVTDSMPDEVTTPGAPI